MAKQLNVSLAFQADTSQAKAQIQGLVNELNKLSSVGIQSKGTEKLTSEIIEAKMAAKDLGVILERSFNVDTGKLDLNKFNSSLKKSGMSLTDYGNKMAMLGTQGDQAFLKIAQSIVETEAPLRRSSGLLKEFGTTLANTARWQISSSILHGFMGSVQKAYGYAQDLNESLNNIRIVTGQNSDQMAIFAERANKAAKALSTTTTDYTNASLIYYQQGLNDQEVQERTDITVKMANAAGQSAEVVSDQLTAVWNNFDNGTKSLEHYADVMTALGAATASSTDEIADGLEKFAAVANTVGLSYEYAASALATVTATTRQSADVVGTAFKTLFARIEGLELGETLDDGTTLNKYSEALMAVGVNIKDSNGEMKEMDTILEEMAAKWDTLNKDQQIALAQTVAGVRQYTQLIALMDNWDFMEENLATSANAAGTLDEQQKIYEESWAASQDRVKASMEGVFDSLIDEDFFIGLNNVLADTLGVVEKLVDAMGGMPGVLSLVGILVTSIFKDQLANGINNAIHNFKNFAGVSHLEMKQLQKEAYQYAQEMTRGLLDTSPGFEAQRNHLTRIYEMQQLTEEAMRGANEEQREAIQAAFNQAKAYSQVAVEAGKAADEAQRLYEEQQKSDSKKYGLLSQKDMQLSADLSVGLTGTDLLREAKNLEFLALEMEGLGDEAADLQNKIKNYKAALKSGDEVELFVYGDELRTSMEQVAEAARFQAEAFAAYQSVLTQATTDVLALEDSVESLQNELQDSSPTIGQIESIRELTFQMQNLGLPVDDVISALERYDKAVRSNDTGEMAKAAKDLGRNFSVLKISAENSEKAIKKQAIAYTGADKSGKRYSTALKVIDKRLDEVTKKSRNAVKGIKNFEEATKTAEQEQKDYAETLKQVQTSIKSFGSGAASAIQGVSSLGMALSSMKGVIDTLSDPDTSGFEKFLSVLTSSGMIIGSLTSGFGQISRGFKDMASAADGSTLSLFQQVAQMKANEIQENSWIGKMQARAAAKAAASAKSVAADTAEATAEKIKEEAIEEANEEEAEGIALDVAGAVSSTVDAGAKSGEAVATIGVAGAQMALNAAIASFIELMLTAIVAILPYVAVAGALAAVIWFIVDAYNADAEALNKANESLDEANKKYEEATQTVKKFKESLNGYEEARENLQSLKGDIEKLNEAVEESNEKARELIETYGLFGKWSYGDFGEIVIDSDALKGIEFKLNYEEQDAKVDKYGASLVQGAAALDSAATNLAREIDTVTVDRGEMSTVEIVDKENIYSLADAIQTYKEANEGVTPSLEELKKYVEENSTNLSLSSTEIELINSKLDNDTYNSLMTFVDSLNQATQAAIDYANEILGVSIGNVYGEDFKNLATDSAGNFDEGLYNLMVAAATNLVKDEDTTTGDTNINQNIQDSYETAKNKVYNDVSNYDSGKGIEDAVADFAGELLGDTEWIKNNYSSIFGEGASYDGNIDTEQMLNDYLTSQGYTVTSVDDKSGKVTASYTTTGGEIVTGREFDNDVIQRQWAEEIVNTIIRSKTEGQVGEDLQGVDSSEETFNVNDVFGNIIENGEQYGVDFANSIMAGIANATEGQPIFDFSGIYDQLAPSQYEELMQMDSSEIGELFGLTPEQMEFLGFKNAEAFAEAFKQGFEGYSVEDAKENMFKNAGIDASQYGLDAQAAEDIAEAFFEMAEAGKEGYEGLIENSEALSDATTRYMRLNNAVLDLSENYDEYSGVLKDVQSAQNKTDRAFAASSASGQKLKKSLSDLLGTSEDLIDADLLDAIDPADFEAAARGDEAAIERIRSEFIKLQAEAAGIDFSGLQSQLDKLEEGATLNLDADSFLSNLITAKLNAGATATDLKNILSGFGITMDNIQFYDSLEAAEEAARASGGVIVDELSYSQETTTDATTVEKNGTTLGFTEIVTAEPKTEYNEVTETDEEGNITTTKLPSTVYQYTKTVQEDEIPVQSSDTVVQNETTTKNGAGQTGDTGGGNKFAVVTGTKSVGNNVSSGTKNTANNNVNNATKSKGGGSGSSSKPKKAEKKKKTDVVERYKKIEDKLDDVRDAQDKASKSADRLYGADRLKQMQKINQTLVKEVKLLQEKKKEAEAYLKVDQQELNNLAKQNGLSFIFDEKGNISNYEEQFTKLWTELDTAINRANADGNATEEEQEKIDKIQERIDTIKEALEQYEETRELIEDIESELQDKIYEIQDNNFEQLNYKFEIKMEISNNSLKWIDYQLEKMEDDFYRAAEAAALFFNILNQEETKYGQTLEQVKITTQQFAEAEKMYNTFDKDGNRLISQANYIEAMNQARNSYYDQLAALQEIDDAMMNYYSDTLDKASEELAKYTDQMDHLSGVLEHYNSLMPLMGKEKDYEKMGIILDGQLKVAEDKLAVSEATYQMYAAEVKKYEDDIASGVYGSMSDQQKELFDKEYQAALQKANEAEEEFLSSAEATIEAWKAKMQNELDGFGRDLEKALTGGTSFDWLITTMERMNSLHEEYLTTTNKIYETNKLMNQAQKEIDKSSNSIAKRKLKDFIEQTKSLQNQTALSKFELDIQQAKYDLLLAEIALEEAQNAKSQVRLQRDSEGNFGYVYTADSSAIDDAQQKLQDAQNNLYNISLDGANKYAEQEVQIRQEMYDTLRELETQYQEGSFASLEEYETARDEAMSYYYDKLEQASNLYNVAISADASAAAEHILGQEYLVAQASFGTFADIANNWQFHLGNMKSNTETWKTGVEEYVGNVISKFGAWETFCKEMYGRTSLTDLANQVGDIAGKSEELRQKITDPKNGVIKALSDEFEAVQKVTGEYGKQREKVQGLITDIENYIKALDNKQKAEVGDMDETAEEKQETSSNTSNKNTTQEVGELAATAKELVGKVHAGKIGNSEDGWILSAKAAGYSEDAIVLALKAFNDSKPGAGYDYYYNEALKILDSYDTGGYTGNWDGSYGKLAMVHKKELILKEGDTANFLASMEVLERILSIIDLQSANAQYVGAINSPALKFTGQDTLEQNVHIEASFPNATDRNEIEEAFKDIVNLASQYANRK